MERIRTENMKMPEGMTDIQLRDDVEVYVIYETESDEITCEEIGAYIKRGCEREPQKDLSRIVIHVEGEDVALKYYYKLQVPFERIRRITGYLVGTTDRFNDAKRAEERDRVKHDASEVGHEHF